MESISEGDLKNLSLLREDINEGNVNNFLLKINEGLEIIDNDYLFARSKDGGLVIKGLGFFSLEGISSMELNFEDRNDSFVTLHVYGEEYHVFKKLYHKFHTGQ